MQDGFAPADQTQSLKTMSVMISRMLHLRLLCHNTIYIYFFVENPEEKHNSGNSGDLLLRNARIFFLLIPSDTDTERKPTHILLDRKFGMQKINFLHL